MKKKQNCQTDHGQPKRCFTTVSNPSAEIAGVIGRLVVRLSRFGNFRQSEISHHIVVPQQCVFLLRGPPC